MDTSIEANPRSRYSGYMQILEAHSGADGSTKGALKIIRHEQGTNKTWYHDLLSSSLCLPSYMHLIFEDMIDIGFWSSKGL